MKRVVIGYIFYAKHLEEDERLFLEMAEKHNIDLVLFNVAKDLDEKEIEEKSKRCDLIFNNSAEDFAIEIVKTLEEMGKKVIDSSGTYYYTEDKWIFFMKCKEHNIPTPDTILLSENLETAKKELKTFGKWPVILKRVSGTMGQYVERAKSIKEAEKIIKHFWKKGSERLPIIAQEFIESPSYRITLVGDKILQTAIKESKNWKATGVYAKKFKKFPIDKNLAQLVQKLIKVIKINVCGIDLLKKAGKWVVLEVNSEPAFDFFEDEREKVIEEVLIFLKRQIKK